MNESAKNTTKNIFDVQVAGLPLKLRSSHDEKTVLELIQFVDKKVSEAMSINNSVSFQNAIVLAALNLAEELLLLKRTLAGEIDRVEERTQGILRKVEGISSANN